MNQRPDHFSESFVPPQAPPELRGRVLTAARNAMERGDSPDMLTRIWESRPVRLAWAASIGALLFGHLVIGGSVSAGPAEPAFPLAAAAVSNDELSEIIGLQRMTVDLPGWEIPSRIADAPTDQSSENGDPS